MKLGGNIELVGFNDLDGGSMIILKKMVGNHVKKMGDFSDIEGLTLTMKSIGSGQSKFEVHAKALTKGRPVVSEVTDHNLFFTVDKALAKVHNGLRR